MTHTEHWLLWQLADSAFPSGGFVHSGGLEAAWQQGEVVSRESLTDFIQTSLKQLGGSMLPLVSEAHQEPGLLPRLDQLCDAFLTNHVANRASRLQGQAFLIAAERTFGRGAISLIRRSVADVQPPSHLAPLFGVVLRLMEVDLQTVRRLFVFLNLRGWIASAVRLGIIGPLEAQGLQFRLTPGAEEVCNQSAKFTSSELVQIAPVLDLLQGAHDRLYSRLFQT